MLSRALRLIRVFHDLNQSQLASRLEVSRSHISEIESGKKAPSLELLDKYSEAFKIPTSSLLLFSERLQDNSFAEKTRVSVARKIEIMLTWLSEAEMGEDEKAGHKG